MRALIHDGKQLLLRTALPTPEPNEGEALIRPLRLGVSATDVQIARGLCAFSGTLGREFVGVVEAVHGAANEFADCRVVGSPIAYCGTCNRCQSGLRTHCHHRTVMGLHDREGCFADRFTLPVANLVRVPETIDDDRAVFALTVASALQSVRQITIEGKPYITVLGDGPLGLITAQVMAKLNASVRLIGRYSEKMAMCEKWGIKHRHVDDIGRRADQDIVVDCTGSPGGFGLGVQLVRPRGTLVIKTLLSEWNTLNAGVDLTNVVLNEIVVIGSHIGSLREAILILEREEVDVISLIGRRMTINDGPAIVSAAQQPGMLKVLVEL